MVRLIVSCPLAALALAFAGCAESKVQPAAHPVSGQVNYDGRPAAGVHVYLIPTSAPMVPEIPSNPHGVTGPDGRFTLTTYAAGDGAPEGGYQVVLLWPAETAEDEEEGEDRLLGWYDAVHSQLTADVKPGGNELKPFNLPAVKGAPEAVQGVPGKN